MIVVWLILLGPAVAALLLAIVVRLALSRALPELDGQFAGPTALAGAAPALILVAAPIALFANPLLISFEAERIEAVLPLALGVLAVVVLMSPRGRRRTGMTADLSRRTVRSLLSPWWIAAIASGAVLITALSIALGTESGQDEQGRYVLQWIDAGTTGTRAASTTYGWYFSVPALIVMAVLLAVTLFAWWALPRPAWAEDRAHDEAVRRLRAANVGRAAMGALLLHLGFILHQLWAMTMAQVIVPASPSGTVTIGSPFAALEPVLAWSDYLAKGLGLALWILIALTAVRSRSRKSAPAPALVR